MTFLMETAHIVIHPDYQHHADFLRTLPKNFEGQGEVIHSGRNTVKRIVHGGQVFIVKRYKRPLWFQRLAYSFVRPTKARRAYEYALRFLQLGIATPFPVAYMESYRSGLFLQGFFVSEEDVRPSCMPFSRGVEPMSDRMVDALAAFLWQLHRQGVLHGDLNMGNILYEEGDGDKVCFSLIDINRSRFVKGLPTYKETIANLWRLTHNRDLGRRVFAAYARLRGWNEDVFVMDLLRRIGHQEKKKKLRKRVFHPFIL